MNKEPEIELSLESLWSLLTPDEQLEAARCFWQGRSPVQREKALQIVMELAQLRNFREKFVRERSLEWKATELCKHLSSPPLNFFIDDVIREFLLEKKRPMVCAILDAEGTAHKDGWISEDATAPTADTLVRGLASVRGKFSDRDLLLYYGIHVSAIGAEHWCALEEALERPEFDQLGKDVFASKCGQGGAARVDSAEDPQKMENHAGRPEIHTVPARGVRCVPARRRGGRH